MPVAYAVAVASAIALAIALCPVSADAAAPPAGVAVHPWRFEASERPPFWPLRDPGARDRAFAALAEAGVQRARVDLRWNVIEPNLKGLRDWSEFDAIHRSAVVHGIELLPSIGFTPRWASTDHRHDVWSPPADPEDYGDFVAAALERYPDIPAWEIWNEPNLAFFWRPRPDVGGFVALLRAADEARKRVGSQAKLVSGGLSSTGEDPFRWFDEMARLGAFAHVDGFALHPYGKTRSPDHRKAFFLKVPEFRRRLVRLGLPDVGIWLTEYGTPNTAAASEYGPPISAEQQAENLGRAYTLASMWPWVKDLSWYELQEGCSDGRDPDCRFGLFDRDFGAKPAFVKLRGVLGGELTRLRSEVTLRAARSKGRVIARGTLVKAGDDAPAGKLTLRARRGARTVSVPARASRGAWSASLRRLGPGRWTIVASYPGTRVHLPVKSVGVRVTVR
jgi:hypothetical protein